MERFSPIAAFDLGFPIRFRLTLLRTCRGERHFVQKLCKSLQHPHLGPSTDAVPRARRNPRFNALCQFTAPRRRGPGRSKGVCRRLPQRRGKSKSNDEGSPASSKPFIHLVEIRRYNVLQAAKATQLPRRTGSWKGLLLPIQIAVHAAAEATSTQPPMPLTNLSPALVVGTFVNLDARFGGR